MENIKGVIFDMDGVLLDTESISFETWAIASKNFNLDSEKSKIANKRCMGTNKNDTIAILKEIFGNDFDGQFFLDETSRLFHEIEFSKGIPIMKGAKECLSFLKEKKYKIALASSTRGPTVKRQLQNAELIQYFQELVTGDLVSHSKPDPEIYALAAKKLNLLPSECVAIEDSPNGIKSAKSAGLTTIMIPDQILPDEELLKLVDYKFTSLFDVIDFFSDKTQ